LKYTSRPTPAIATDAEAVVTMVVGKGSAIVKYTISDEVLYEAAWYSAGFLGMAPPGVTPELFMPATGTRTARHYTQKQPFPLF